MISRRAFAALAGAALLAGCASARPPQHGLPLDLVQSFKFAGIEGRVDPEVKGVWLSMKNDFFKSKGIVIPLPDNENPGRPLKDAAMPLAAEFTAFLSHEFDQRIRRVFAEPLAQELRGTRPVKIVVTLLAVDLLPYSARGLKQRTTTRDHNNYIDVSFEIADAQSGQSLLRSAPFLQPEWATGLGGRRSMFDRDLMVRMLAQLQPHFSSWLLKRAAG